MVCTCKMCNTEANKVLQDALKVLDNQSLQGAGHDPVCLRCKMHVFTVKSEKGRMRICYIY